jgi:RNA polymerase sigma-70 factor (ECF subfamily)
VPDAAPRALDADAYGQLLTPLLPRASGYARSLLGGRADAEDAVQQAALRGLERLHAYEPSRSFSGWWFTLLHHSCIDLLRARRRTTTLEAAESATARTADGDGALAWDELARGLAALDPDHERILRLRYFGGLAYADLGEALGIPPGTVMSRLHAARQRLAEILRRTERTL